MPEKNHPELDAKGLALDRELIRLREENARIKEERESLRKDVKRLDGIVRQLIRGADSLLCSQRWKLGHFLGSLKYRLSCRPPLPPPTGQIRSAKARYDHWLSRRAQPLLSTAGPEPGTSSPKGRRKVSVIAWDVSHNPLGRAYLLAESLSKECDVEVIGPTHSRYGDRIWEPLRNPRLPLRYFEGDGEDCVRYFKILDYISDRIDSDLIYVSKPRMPAMLLGILAKSKRNIPLVLDIDDYELSFFNNRPAVSLEKIRSLSGREELNCLYGEIWTRYADSLIRHFDGITVSNAELQGKYGGTVIPHLRDENLFNPSRFGNRAEIRKQFGYTDSDRVILFVGTLKLHKGVGDIVRALRKLGEPSYKLCVIGTVGDEKLRELLQTDSTGNVKIISAQSFFELPYYLQLADLICILQDPDNPISQYQMPAKFTDALSMGIPVIAYDVPPLRPYHKSGLVEFVDRASLPAKLAGIFRDYSRFKDRALRNIDFFRKEFSYESGGKRLMEVFTNALRNNKPLDDEFRELLEFLAAPGSGRGTGA
jgi:glycosyltransferase involved in cell wall biosynthesis